MESIEKKTILIVEDNEDARKLLQITLKADGYETWLAADGLEALKLLAEKSCPDLVLLDLSLPNLEASEFMQKMREVEGCAEVKVVIVSGWDGLAQRAKQLGACGYVRKPVELRQLEREIRKHIG